MCAQAQLLTDVCFANMLQPSEEHVDEVECPEMDPCTLLSKRVSDLISNPIPALQIANKSFTVCAAAAAAMQKLVA